MKKEKLIKKIEPYWRKYWKIKKNFINEVIKIENKMNKDLKKLNLPKLEFFWVDGEPVGIGAANYIDRKNFDLIHDTELMKNEY
ncbi:MAG: hypothetical protein WD876_02100 [Candidatus Pacearchaeota archaeon]